MHRVLLLREGDLHWAEKECKELLEGKADVLRLESPSRAAFFADCQPGGKYDGVTCILHLNASAARIGQFNAELVRALPASVRWVAHRGAGYDMIDIGACAARGIAVSNTPGAVDNATATTALYLLLSTVRRFSAAERAVRAGRWKEGHAAGDAHDLEGRTIAILGLGGIGLRLAQYLQVFPMRVVYHNRHPSEVAPEWCEYFPAERLDEMLAIADVLSVHVPLNEQTVGFVGESMIRKLKKGAILLNTARGKVVDEEAMIRALEDGHLSAIGLDVFPNEPHPNPRLFEFPNATLLPHLGTDTRESMTSMEVRALTNLHDFITKGRGHDIVPEMQ